MANLSIHPAPGMGDLTAGFYVVPQNPIQMASEGISRVPTLGEFMSGSFPVPQNPFCDYVGGTVKPLGQGAAGMSGLGCGPNCGCGMSGLGDLSSSLSSIESWLQQDSLGFGAPNWAYAAGAMAVYLVIFGGQKGTSRAYRARRAYRAYAAA